jgi:putative ABC transport system permease protein
MEALVQDIRYAVRTLLKSPGFTLVAVITLALGIGAITAIFGVVDAVLLKPLVYQQADRLVAVWASDPQATDAALQVSFPNFADIRKQSGSFAQLAVFRYWLFNLSGESGPEAVLGVYAGDSLFTALRVRPTLGRSFAGGADTPGYPREALLSYGLWARRYGADPNIIGAKVTVDGAPTTVVGVLPRGFRFPELVPANVPLPSREPDIYVAIGAEGDNHQSRGNQNYSLIGRLDPGVAIPQVKSELDVIAHRLAAEYPDQNAHLGLAVCPLKDQVIGAAGRPLVVLLGAVVFVLLIACANVGGLQLARAAGRERELAVRTALGASPLRLARQLLTESAVLSLAGGSLGVVLAAWGIQTLRVSAPNSLPRLGEVSLDASVLVFTLVTSLVSGLLFGLWPVLRRSGDTADALREGGRHSWSTQRRRLRAGIVIAEVAISIVLLTGASLLLRSFARLVAVDPGFDGTNVITMFALLPPSHFTTMTSMATYERLVQQRISTIPGVTSAGSVNTLPLSNIGNMTTVDILDHPAPSMADAPPAGYRSIGGDYFASLRIPIVQGRNFATGDTAGAPPVAIINQAAAKQFYPGENPIGRRLRLMGGDTAVKTIVGIVRDTHGEGLELAANPEVSFPYQQGPDVVFTLVIRTQGDPHALLPAINRELGAVDPQQPYWAVRTMPELVAASVAQRRFNLVLLGGFAAAALLLAAIGLYGLIAYSVSQRTQEIGIRMALGAGQRLVLSLVLRDGMVLTTAGVGIGLVAAALLSRVLRSQLYDVGTIDPLAYGGVVVVFAAIAALASYVPARRAASVDPVEALRTE